MRAPPALPSIKVVAFHGESAGNILRSDDLDRVLREHLQRFLSGNQRLLACCSITGPADVLFARTALDLGIPLALILPQPRETLRERLPDSIRPDLDKIFSRAAKIEIATASRETQTASLGQKLIDQADILIAVWPGGDGESNDRMARLVDYAGYRGRPVVTLRLRDEAFESREINPGVENEQPRIEAEALLAGLGPPPPAPAIPEELTAYFQACDEEATRTAPQVRRHFLNIVLANATASVAGSIDSSFPQTPLTGAALNIIRFGCVLLGLGIFIVLRHRQSQNHWLGLRLRAELCRSAMATWLSPRDIKPLEPDQAPELRDLIQAIHYFHTIHPPPAGLTLDQIKSDYGNRRLLDQLNYFRKQADSAVHLGTWLTPFYWVFTCLALGTSAGSFVYQTVFGHGLAAGSWVSFLFNFIPAIAPALASWILSFQAIQSIGRRRARFREMERLMRQALIDLVHCQTEDEVHHLIKRSEKLLLNEVLEWYSFVKYGR
jgi:hypothetical protein